MQCANTKLHVLNEIKCIPEQKLSTRIKCQSNKFCILFFLEFLILKNHRKTKNKKIKWPKKWVNIKSMDAYVTRKWQWWCILVQKKLCGSLKHVFYVNDKKKIEGAENFLVLFINMWIFLWMFLSLVPNACRGSSI